jgi:hypothetical protein
MPSLLNATEITNWFLYGQRTTPINLVDESLIRPANDTSNVTQDMATMAFKAAEGLRIVIAGAVLACLMDCAAMACPGSADQRIVFFDEVPSIIFDDAHGIFVAPPEVAVEIAIIRMNGVPAVCPTGDLRCRFQVGVAEVNRVLRGQVGSRRIKIVAPAGDCDEQLQVGAKGIVIGDLRRNADGELELVLVSESEIQQQLRKSAVTLHGKWWR